MELQFSSYYHNSRLVYRKYKKNLPPTKQTVISFHIYVIKHFFMHVILSNMIIEQASFNMKKYPFSLFLIITYDNDINSPIFIDTINTIIHYKPEQKEFHFIGMKVSTGWNSCFNRMKLKFRAIETKVPAV